MSFKVFTLLVAYYVAYVHMQVMKSTRSSLKYFLFNLPW